jgi:hypothetical protein
LRVDRAGGINQSLLCIGITSNVGCCGCCGCCGVILLGAGDGGVGVADLLCVGGGVLGNEGSRGVSGGVARWCLGVVIGGVVFCGVCVSGVKVNGEVGGVLNGNATARGGAEEGEGGGRGARGDASVWEARRCLRGGSMGIAGVRASTEFARLGEMMNVSG